MVIVKWADFASLGQSDRSSVAAFIHLLRKLITHSLEMQEDVTQSSVLAVIGLLLSRIESQLLDVDVLFALEALVEAAQGSQVWISLLTDVYQNLLFNFRIWVKAEFTVRLGKKNLVSLFMVKKAGIYFVRQ